MTLNIFTGMNGMDSSLPWIFENFDSEGKRNPHLICWIHSHVGGIKCGFSSIDVHTQHTIAKIHDEVLGMVIELNESGQIANHDFYEISRQGSRCVESCSRKRGCNAMQQHDSCYNVNFYKSVGDKVLLHDDFELKIQNYMSPNARLQNEQTNNETDPCQSFQKHTHQQMETNESCEDPISYHFSQFIVDASELVRCKVCRKKMAKTDSHKHLEESTWCQKKLNEKTKRCPIEYLNRCWI